MGQGRRWFSTARVVCSLVAGMAMLPGGFAFADDALRDAPHAPSTSIAALHSDLKLSLLAPLRERGEPSVDGLERQARRLLEGLQASALRAYPEALARLAGFEVLIADSREVSAMSSATGRIALSAGFADLAPTDDWLALVIAREMGHVIAGHHDNNSTASIVTSLLMNLVVPGSQLIKSALSFAGSQVAAASGRERQLGEADEVAMRLLEGAGYTVRSLALNLALGPGELRLGTSGWARGFVASAQALLARGRPSPERLGDPVQPNVAATSARHLGTPGSRPGLAPEDIVVRHRPSGMPGPLMLGGHLVPVRRIE